MAAEINRYGDQLIRTTGTHGSNISSQRIDDLDKESLSHLINTKIKGTCVDLGCGDAYQSLRFSLLLNNVYAYDLIKPELIDQVSKKLGLDYFLNFIICDLSDRDSDLFPENISCIYSQRFIHYLDFNNAVFLMRKVWSKCIDEGKVFISASGLLSELSNDYLDKHTPVEKRYAYLSSQMAEKHDIKSQVCLYTQDDIALLLQQSGFMCNRVWQSEFGNIKAIGTKTWRSW